jgi:hypothetical protein
MNKKDLPKIICLEDYNGNYHNYIDAVYAIFERDLVKNRPDFGSHKLQLKSLPLFQNRAYTFYHLTHKGEIESEREPDFRRCERIAWVKPTIENTEKWNLKFWKQSRNGKSRVCIQLKVEEDVDYYVILDVRTNYILIWTAFIAEYEHEKRKKEKEYADWVKENKGKTYTPNSLIAEIFDDWQKKQGSQCATP